MPDRQFVCCALALWIVPGSSGPAGAQEPRGELRARVSNGDTCTTDYRATIEEDWSAPRQHVERTTSQHQRWTQRLLDVDSRGEVLALTRTYSVASETIATPRMRRTHSTRLQGMTVAVKRVDGTTVVSSSPRRLRGLDRKLAETLLTIEGAALLPGREVTVGEEWQGTLPLVNSLLEPFDAVSWHAVVKLLGVSTVRGQRCARVHLETTISVADGPDAGTKIELSGDAVFAVDLGKLVSMRLDGPARFLVVQREGKAAIPYLSAPVAAMHFQWTNTWTKAGGKVLMPAHQ